MGSSYLVTPQRMLHCGGLEEFSSACAEWIQPCGLSTIPSSVDAVMDPELFQDHQESRKSSH